MHQYSSQPLEKQRLENFLTGLGSSLPERKAFAYFPRKVRCYCNFREITIEWQRFALPVSQGYVTLIGEQLDYPVRGTYLIALFYPEIIKKSDVHGLLA